LFRFADERVVSVNTAAAGGNAGAAGRGCGGDDLIRPPAASNNADDADNLDFVQAEACYFSIDISTSVRRRLAR
jgi:hypothetical protein